MFPTSPRPVDAKARQLLGWWRKLDDARRQQLLDFAEFLVSKNANPEPAVECAQPVAVPKAENESVVAAIKRLTATYPMLDKQELLGVTSTLMSRHLLQGEPRESVIAELEREFEQRFQAKRDTSIHYDKL